MDDLVSVEWLAAHLGHSGLVVLDATYLPFEPDRDAAAEFAAGHIPGARFLDLKTLADTDDPRPTMAPRLDQFRARMAALDILSPESIVLYDNSPHRTSARAWWLLRLFGTPSVAILDGGLEGWRAAGLPLEAGPAPHPSHGAVATGFVHRADGMIADMDDVRRAVGKGGAQIVDARGHARFTGEEPDPRPGVAPGHMPGALNLPYSRLFEPDGRWKSREALAAEFAAAGVDPARPMIFTCGSGITAAGLLFAAHLLGHDDARLYDGSWSEWGADPSTPKATGTA
ncbi:MAG TPA: sulfurtransferase [Sphingomonas sp.]|nr:sulfurtransferase [Sphingomonas sp.]